MANSLNPVTTDLTAFGRIFLSALKSRLVLAGMIPRGDIAGATMIGNKVTYPDISVSGDAAVRAIGGAATASDLIATSRTLTVQQVYKAITVENLHNLFATPSLMVRAAEQLAYKVAKKCDSIVAGLWNKMPYEVGPVDGTAAFNATTAHGVLADAYKVLFDNEADTSNLRLVLGSKEATAFRKLTNLYKVNEAGSSDVLRTQSLGRVLGFDIYESQMIQDNFSSVAGESASPGAVVGVNAIGATTLSMNSLGSGTLQSGTSFTIAGFSKRYIVTDDATITTNAAIPNIYPPLEAATSGSEAITFLEHSTATSSQNFAFNPEAFRSIVMPSFPLGGGVDEAIVSDPQTNLSVRIAKQSTLLGGAGTAYTQNLAADCMFGADVVREGFVVRITGD
jgi:hypothetical protein